MLRYLIDPANAITTAGLICSLLSLYLALNGQIELAVAVALWAVLADHLDGDVAGRTPHRHPDMAKFSRGRIHTALFLDGREQRLGISRPGVESMQ
ncbi:hypothetical protein CDO26_37100 (plasmid) [Sinorhizobium meliloti]|uniref:CDP-alcohol phosphatidyltransferase family protein n=1 Tax=Rhizobium meliloti TaxID=382 RepID=UPI000B497B4A|nr:CDP-alcohol phosphatidyltransferase family protein [Sinorhizobium meliloti]ASP89700.1 hypothetical protein CDO26_37100 [Sinorhizobium meliloti]MQW29609.1 hypothetical protein [Sinorhizobium meliloti]